MRAWLCTSIALLFAVACGQEFTAAGGGTGGDGTAGGVTTTDTSSTTSSDTDTSTSTNTGGSGPVGPENCLNGVDDDGDDKIDCEDEECVCAPPPPTGWTGLGWLFPKADGSCADGVFFESIDLFEKSDLKAPAAECACSCGPGQDVGCQTFMTCSAGSDCLLSGAASTIGETCLVFPQGTFSAQVACKAAPPYAVGGTCDPKSTKVNKPVEWAPSRRACLYESGGACEGQGFCLPAPPDNADGPCIGREGGYECPAPYTQKKSFYDGNFEDNRGCEDCSCGQLEGATCECQSKSCGVGIYGSAACNDNFITVVPADNTCTPFSVSNNAPSGVLEQAKVKALGECKPSPAAPTGSVKATGKLTVCCLP